MFGYNIKQAFTYFLKDDKKLLKIIVLTVILTALAYLNSKIQNDPKNSQNYVYFLISLIPCLYFCGYVAKTTNSRIVKPQEKLPEITDILGCSTVGFKNVIAYVLYSIWGAMLFIFIPALIMMFSTIFIKTVLPVGIIMRFLGFALAVIAFPIFLLGIFAVQIAFTANLKIKSAVNTKLFKHILIKNIKSFLPLVFILIIIGGLIALISQIFNLIPFLGTIVSSLLWVYWYLASSDLQAQFARRIFKIGQGEVVNG